MTGAQTEKVALPVKVGHTGEDTHHCLPAARVRGGAAWAAGLCQRGRLAGAALVACGGGRQAYARTLSPTALGATA